jgi:hypothetical protein
MAAGDALDCIGDIASKNPDSLPLTQEMVGKIGKSAFEGTRLRYFFASFWVAHVSEEKFREVDLSERKFAAEILNVAMHNLSRAAFVYNPCCVYHEHDGQEARDGETFNSYKSESGDEASKSTANEENETSIYSCRARLYVFVSKGGLPAECREAREWKADGECPNWF